MDYLVIAFPTTHTLAYLNGTQIVHLADMGGGQHRYRMIARAPKAMTFIAAGKNNDEIFLLFEHVKSHSESNEPTQSLINRYRMRPLDA